MKQNTAKKAIKKKNINIIIYRHTMTMNNKSLLILVFFVLQVMNSWAQKTFAFHNNRFRIAQFTDLHWDPQSAKCDSTRNTMLKILQREKPDIAILTGDVVTEKPYEKGWKQIIEIFETAHIPFVVTMGNHDAEHFSRDEIYHILFTSKLYSGIPSPEDISGNGNCALPIYASNTANARPKAVLYCIDSNDYQPDKDLGEYDWIHFNQIEWYRRTSEAFTLKNNNRPLPSLMFFHIPLVEYHNVLERGDYQGKYEDDGIWSARINSGMFGSLVDKKDVIGVFAGHDHQNDLIGLERKIALGYGRVSGYDAYGALKPGARIIELYEDLFKFDTWIATNDGNSDYFYYPSGLSSKDEEQLTLMPALSVQPKQNGISYRYYEGNMRQTADILKATLKQQGVMPNFTINEDGSKDHFGYIYSAYIKVPESGVYRFYTYSDDGSRLFIDGVEIVNNDGGHSARRAEGKANLAAGFHKLELHYFENYMGQALEVGFSTKDIPERTIAPSMLWIDGEVKKKK